MGRERIHLAEPSISSLHINSALTDLATLISSDLEGFVGLKVAPPFPVQKVSDRVWTLDARAMFRADDNREGPDGFLNEIRWKDSDVSYTLTRHGSSRFVSDVEEANADPMVKPSRAAQRILVRRCMNALEKAILDAATSTANFANNTTLTAGSQWNDPGVDIDSQVTTAIQTPLGRPNAVVMNEQSFRALQNAGQIKEKYKFTGSGLVPEDIIKQVLNVDHVFVSRAKYDSADELAAASYGYIMGKDVLFFHYDPTPAKESLNTMWTFWLKAAGVGGPAAMGSNNPFYVRETRDPRRAGGGTYYDCEAWYDEAYVMAADTAYLIKAAIA